VSGRGYVGLLLIDLHFPEAGSLKDKRAELRPVRERLRHMGLSVAEIDHHDRWQRATLAGALVASSIGRLEELADAVQRWLDARFESGAAVRRVVVSTGELLDLGLEAGRV